MRNFIKTPLFLALVSGGVVVVTVVILIVSIATQKEPTSPAANQPVNSIEDVSSLQDLSSIEDVNSQQDLSSIEKISSTETNSQPQTLLVDLDVAAGSDYLDIGICNKKSGKRLEGVSFSVTVKKDSNKAKNYQSTGKSKILLSSLAPGDYTITLLDSDTFNISKKTVKTKIEKIEYKENIIEQTTVIDKNKTDEEDPIIKPSVKEEEKEEVKPSQNSSSEESSSQETSSQTDGSKSPFAPPITTDNGDYIYNIVSKSLITQEKFNELIKNVAETKIFFDNNDGQAEKSLLISDLNNTLLSSGHEVLAEISSSENQKSNDFIKENHYLTVYGYVINTEIHTKGLLCETATDIAVCSKGEFFVLKVKAIVDPQDFTEGFFTKGTKTYYLKSDATVVTNWYNINLRRHFFSDKGVLSSVHGIDVSSYQNMADKKGKIYWDKVYNDNIEFAIIRAGFKGYETGVNKIDSYCEENIKGAKAAGLKVGLYFFSQAITVAEAAEEASILIDLAKKYDIKMPLAIDTELIGSSTARADKLSVSQRTAIVKAFCETVKEAGFEPMVYTGRNFYINNLNGKELTDYKLWIARYPADANLYETPNISAKYHIWQYASDGKVSGISGNVDMNSMIVG